MRRRCGSSRTSVAAARSPHVKSASFASRRTPRESRSLARSLQLSSAGSRSPTIAIPMCTSAGTRALVPRSGAARIHLAGALPVAGILTARNTGAIAPRERPGRRAGRSARHRVPIPERISATRSARTAHAGGSIPSATKKPRSQNRVRGHETPSASPAPKVWAERSAISPQPSGCRLPSCRFSDR